MIVGLLHPGEMGQTVGAACSAPVVWCSDGRSASTCERAARFTDVVTLEALVEQADAIVSVCPPAQAVAVAETVAGLGFDGLYVDANAIAPATARTIAGHFARFVDGGIVGPPARLPGTTRLYLSGPEADRVAALWEGSALDARVIDDRPGSASALKMAYATWTKISGALLLDVRALARREGVEAELLDEWAISQPGTEARSEATAGGVAPKAWRFVGEMEQIAAAFADADLPDGFAHGALDLYRRLAGFKGADATDLEAVLSALTEESRSGSAD